MPGFRCLGTFVIETYLEAVSTRASLQAVGVDGEIPDRLCSGRRRDKPSQCGHAPEDPKVLFSCGFPQYLLLVLTSFIQCSLEYGQLDAQEYKPRFPHHVLRKCLGEYDLCFPSLVSFP